MTSYGHPNLVRIWTGSGRPYDVLQLRLKNFHSGCNPDVFAMLYMDVFSTLKRRKMFTGKALIFQNLRGSFMILILMNVSLLKALRK